MDKAVAIAKGRRSGSVSVISPRPNVLGRQASYWVSVAIVAHTLWTSAAPAMIYPVYAAQWHLSHAAITAVFAIYPIVVVAVLIGFGDISDHIGRRITMLMGLMASLCGVLLFAVAHDVWYLFAGRALMGLGVGLSAGPSTAAVVEFSAAGRADRAGSTTAIAQSVGFGAALLVGGALVEYAPYPTRLNFWVLAVLIAVLASLTWLLPRDAVDGDNSGWRPRVPSLPSGLRREFVVSAMAVTTAYTHGVLILSLGAHVAHDLVQSNNVFVNGAALSVFALSSGVVGILARRLASSRAMVLGAAASGIGMVFLVGSVKWQSLPLFLLATATSGAGYSLLFVGGIGTINGASPVHQRSAVLSAIYLFAYLSLGLVALSLGQVATYYGLGLAIDMGAGVMMVLSLVTAVLVGYGRIMEAGVLHRVHNGCRG